MRLIIDKFNTILSKYNSKDLFYETFKKNFYLESEMEADALLEYIFVNAVLDDENPFYEMVCAGLNKEFKHGQAIVDDFVKFGAAHFLILRLSKNVVKPLGEEYSALVGVISNRITDDVVESLKEEVEELKEKEARKKEAEKESESKELPENEEATEQV